MQTGIIGLPHSGKTSLFKILTHAHLDAKSARAATHIGVAKVPDARLDKLAELFKPKKLTHASIEYVDVGGLAQDRTKDSAYFVQLREADALAHVVRAFDDPATPHPAGSVNPARDIEGVELELMLTDLDQLTRRMERLEKELLRKKEPGQERELALLGRCRKEIEAERPLRELECHADERKVLSSFMFLSQKPMLYVLNVGEEEVGALDAAAERHGVAGHAVRKGTAVVAVCGKVEAELAELEDAEAAELMAAYGLTEPGLDRLIRATYKLLGLISFFTVSEQECRAWTIRRGMTAVEAAGAVHTDFARNFIKAEVVRWDDLLEGGGFAGARERGKLKLEGKEFVVDDGQIVHFRHGA